MSVSKPKEITLKSEKMATIDFSKLKKLADECLRFKWISDQSINLKRILSPCAFCIDIINSGSNCSKCSILKIICDEEGNKGLIGFVFSRYGNDFLKNIDKVEYELIRQALIEISNHGKISSSLKNKIKNLIKDSKS